MRQAERFAIMKNATGLFRICLCLVLLSFTFSPVQSALSSEDSQPEEIVINHLENEYSGVEFDHSTHTMIAEECGKCHHHAGSDEKLGCLNCHSLEPTLFQESAKVKFIPCKDCHTDPDRDNPAMPSIKVAYHQQCFTCHKGIEGIGEGPTGCVELCHERK